MAANGMRSPYFCIWSINTSEPVNSTCRYPSGCNCERRYSHSYSNDSCSHSASATCNSSHCSNCRRPAAAYGTHPNQPAPKNRRERVTCLVLCMAPGATASAEPRRRTPTTDVRRPRARPANRPIAPSAAGQQLGISIITALLIDCPFVPR